MAKQRVQVQELDAGSLVVRPTASPVDTYVRPASEQPTLTPLSQFVNAISPAVEAKANEMKTEKLKLERKEEAYKLRMQDAQAKAKMGELTLDISQQYDSNSESFHEKYPNAQLAVEAYNKPVETYLEKLRQDPTVDQSIIQDMEYYAEVNKIAFATTYNTNQLKINRTKVDNNFINQVAKVNEANNKTTEEQVEMIQTLADQMANGFLLPTGKPDYKRFNTLLVDFLHDTRAVNANSSLYDAVSNMVTKDGNYLNILNSADFAKKGADIEAARESAIKAGNTARKNLAEESSLQDKVKLAVETGNPNALNLGVAVTEIVDVDGVPTEITTTLTKAKITQELYATTAAEILYLKNSLPEETEVQKQSKEEAIISAQKRHYELYQNVKIQPPEVKVVTNNFSTLLTSDLNMFETDAQGNVTYPNREKAETIYKTMKNVENFVGDTGMAQLGFTDDQLNFYAAVKSGVEANEPFFDALNVARQYDPDTAVDPKVTQDDIKKFDDTSWFPFYRGVQGNKVTADIVNWGDVTNKINERAKILMSTGVRMDREAAIEKATQQILTDYRTIDMPNGQSTLVKAQNLVGNDERDKSLNLVANTLNNVMKNPSFIQAVLNTYNIATPAVDIAATDFARARIASTAFTIMPMNNFTNPNQIDLYVVETDANGNIDPSGNAYRLPQSMDLLNLGENQEQLIIDSVFTKKAEEVDPNLPSLAEDPRMFTTELNDMETMLKEQGGRPLNEALSEVGSAIGNAIGGTVSEATGKIGEAIGSTIESFSQSPTGEVLSEEEIQNKMEETFKDLQGSNETSEQVDGSQVLANVQEMIGQLNPIKSAIASTIIEDEGFKATPYDDMGKQSVGHGLQIESLEPDERALIKDINNVQPEESQAVVALKVDKISNYFSDVVDGFQNLPETAQSAMVQMGYQLGQYNVTKDWTEFMKSMKEAAKYAEGSVEQAVALANAQFNMLNTVRKDGTIKATKWATQTADRAMKVASELGASIKEAVIPTAEASTLTPEQQVKEEDNILKKVFDTIYKLDVTPANATQLIKNTLFGDTEVNFLDLNASDLSMLKGLVTEKLATGDTDISYEDFGTTGQGSIKKGFLETFKLSVTSPEYRMATLLGASTIKVEGDKVYIVDTYDFNKGTKGASFKNFVEKGEFTKAYKVLEDVPFTEKLRIIAYMTQPETAVKGGVKIYVGKKKDLT